MRAKVYLCTLVAFVLVVSGSVLVAEAMAPESNDSASIVAAEASVPTCETIQRGTFGEVADGYIWEASPGTSGNTAYLYTGLVVSGEKRSLIRFGLDFLPDGAAVQSATFGIEEVSRGSGETITIYRITEPWSEGEPTWDNFANNYDATVEWGSFVAAGGPDALTANVTGLVSAWADGEEPNYGLLLMNSDGQVVDRYASSETGDVASRPWLEVCYIVNNDPLAMDDEAVTDEDTPVDINVLENDSDPDDDLLIVSDYDDTSAEGGMVDCTSAGLCTYTPPVGFNGADTFTYTASDGRGGTDTATVTVTVNPTNGPPVAVDDSATTDEDTP
ncbi:MAG: DNRLRE domain-containing protein, partial [Anaerolineae bacterium]|nr:DNRLRE domain-containing protein [Anaerolineae bacterium]